MKKLGYVLLICLSILISLVFSTDSYAEGARYNPESVDIYCLSENYNDVLGEEFSERNYASSYQIVLGDDMTGAPEYEVISGDVCVSSTGLVTPYYSTIIYASTGASYKEYYSGTATVKVTCGDYSETITINVREFSDVYANERIDSIIGSVITDGMNEYEKLDALTKWIADNTTYSGRYQSCKNMLIYECGDCWASTNTLVALCKKAGIQAKERSGYMDGSDSHENVIAKCDGEYYVAEAGYYSETKPRMYTIKAEPGGFAYTCNENKEYFIYQYDGFETEVVIPEQIEKHTITRLGSNGPLFNNKITSVTIPKTIDTICDGAFSASSSLTSITVDSDNEYYEAANGLLYTKGKGKLLFVPKAISNISIDPATTEIGNYVFSEMTFDSLTIPGTVKKIGDHALYKAKIDNLVIEEGVETLDSYAFSYSEIDNIHLPSTVSSLGTAVFTCSTASRINIPDAVTEIPLHAFSSCKNLKELTIKKSVTKIGNVAFQVCTKLDNIYYEGTEEEWASLIGTQKLPSNTVVRCNPVRVTGISLDETDITLEYQNEKKTLNASVLPENASNQDIKYYTSDVNVVSVFGNSISASGEGSCTVKAVTVDGEYEAIYNVTVKYKKFKLSVVDGKITSPSDISGLEAGVDILPGTRVVVTYSPEKCSAGYSFAGWESSPDLTLYSGTMTSDRIVFYMPDNDVTLTGIYNPILLNSLSMVCSKDEMCAGNTQQISTWHSPATVYNDILSWSTSDNDIATVDDNGLLTAKSPGLVTVTASTTDGSDISRSVTVNIINHGFRYETISDPTCTEKGKKKCTCRFCKNVYEEDIPELGHDYTEWVDVYGDATLFTRTCNRCDLVETETHRYDDGVVTKEPTCIEEGEMTFTCIDCEFTKTETIPVSEHSLTYYAVVEPKLDSRGVREYYSCNVCGKMYANDDCQEELTVDDLPISLFAKDGINKYEDDWYYIADGVWAPGYTGSANGTVNGTKGWYYIREGKVDFGFKGFAIVGSSWMYFTNGMVDKSLNADHYETYCGVINGDKAWYVVKAGKAYLDFTGFALVGESWMYYKNGKIDKSVTGAMNVTINGVKKWYYVNNGKANLTYTGFGKVGSSWMYFKNGSIDKSVTGIKSGTIDGVKAKYYVKSGKFQNTYSGTYKSGGKTYTIKNGKVTAVK